ncbi:hypothetical protein PENANT_c001G08256 [Penicillium antarcticum]|uniref:C3H1-type domain-containing protein n=1 Tax=Penicillium antarcticum TaxID=416450 RepID=A0A1V6QPK8_9EURO|nr:hypothetical protein PENANT_c001G08256 [Penicillium antarcticum]
MPPHRNPRFFATREDGTMTPLVPVDELPAHISIRGVARTLEAGDTQGMTSCGVATRRTDPWDLEGLSTALPFVKGPEALAELKDSLTRVVNDETVTATTRLSVQAILYKGLAEAENVPTPSSTIVSNTVMSPLAPAFQANNGQIARPNGVHPKKIYCSYWIRHGECDYSQQGCLYKHDMPTQPELLEKLGLRDIPRWFREKHGVESLVHPVQQYRTTSRLAITEQSQSSTPGIQFPGTPTPEIKGPAPQPKQRSPFHGPPNGGAAHPRGPRNTSGWKSRQTKGKSILPASVLPETITSFHSSIYDSASTTDSTGYTEFLQRGALANAMVPISTQAQFVMPTLANPNANLMDTGSSYHSPSANVDNLTVSKDPFEHGFPDASNPVDKTHLRSKSRPSHQQHKLNHSSVDGGVKLPTDLYIQMGSFSALADLDGNNESAAGTQASSFSNQAVRSDSKSPLSDIVSESDPLEENDIRDAWGAVGTPISPPTARVTAPLPACAATRSIGSQPAGLVADSNQHQRSATVIRSFPSSYSNVSHTH